MKCRDHCRSLRILAFAVVFVVLVAISAAALADSASIGRLYVTTDWRNNVRFGDVQHYAVSVRPEQSAHDVYAVWLLGDGLTQINVESTMSCIVHDDTVLCHQNILTDTATVDVYATVIDIHASTLIVGDNRMEHWRIMPSVRYLGSSGGTVPMPEDWMGHKLYFSIARG